MVFGRETDGISHTMSDAADRHLYYPMTGFTESLNLSVCVACVTQRLLDLNPHLRGNLDDTTKHELREVWYKALAKQGWQRALYPQYVDCPPSPEPDLRLSQAERVVSGSLDAGSGVQ